jgi:hypothetical protein
MLPLGGNALINGSSEAELSEVKRISTNVAALIDSERSQEGAALSPDRKAFMELCRKLAINCHALNRRAIENYFSHMAVKAIKGQKYRALAQYEALNAAPVAWSKEENWRIARQMTKSDIGETDLGKFIADL